MRKKFQPIWEFFTEASRGRTLTLGAVLFLIAILPVAISAVDHQTAIKQHAAGATECTNRKGVCTTIGIAKGSCDNYEAGLGCTAPNGYCCDPAPLPTPNCTDAPIIHTCTNNNYFSRAYQVCEGQEVTLSSITCPGPAGCDPKTGLCLPQPHCTCDDPGNGGRFTCTGDSNPLYCSAWNNNAIPCYSAPNGEAMCGTTTGKPFCSIPFLDPDDGSSGGSNPIYSGETGAGTEQHFYCAHDEFCYNDPNSQYHCVKNNIKQSIIVCSTPNDPHTNFYGGDGKKADRKSCASGVACRNVINGTTLDVYCGSDKVASTDLSTVMDPSALIVPTTTSDTPTDTPTPTPTQPPCQGNSCSTPDTPVPTNPSTNGATPTTDSPTGTPIKAITLTIVLGLPGIGYNGPVGVSPHHTTRTITLELYAGNVTTPSGPGTHPVIPPLTTTVQFDSRMDNNAGYFVSQPITINLPSTPPANSQYKILIKIPQYLYKLAINPVTQNGSDPTIFTITTADPIVLPPLILSPGDVAFGNGQSNIIDVNDYTQLKACFDNPSACPTTPDGLMYGDFDDNGKIDIVDFNIGERSIFALQNANPPVCKDGACQGD